MADASLEDFFAKKNKKKIKGSNLNVAATAPKAEPKKKAKDAEEDGWEEEQVVTQTIKIEVAGKLTRDEDKKDEEDNSAPAWGNVKKYEQQRDARAEKQYPALAKSVQSSNISIEDSSAVKVNISTSKNAFAALEDDRDDDEDGKRPKEIKPAMVKKQKGEREKVALQREVDKWGPAGGPVKEKPEPSKKDKKDAKAEDAEDEETAPKTAKEANKENQETTETGNDAPAQEEEAEEDEEEEEEEQIQLDTKLRKEKYKSRRRLPLKDLPLEEIHEPKESRPVKRPGKKKVFADEEDTKLMVAPEGW